MLGDVKLEEAHHESKLQEARTASVQNIENLEKVARAAKRVQAKFTKESIERHQERKVKLEELQAALSLSELFGKFCAMMQTETADELRQLHEVVSRMLCTSEAYKQEVSRAVVGRLEEFRKCFDQAHLSRAQNCFERYGLPLKKETSVQKVMEPEDEAMLRNYIAVEAKLIDVFKLLGRAFESTLLGSLFSKPIAAIQYHFLDKASELYKVHEPNWMLNYISDAIEANVNFMLRELTLSRQQYAFITLTTVNLLAKQPILERLRLDLPALSASGELLYAFVESVINFEQNLNHRYEILTESQPQSLFQLLIRSFSREQLLQKLLQFEELCFENRIFRDFVHIDYSRINLKNVEAFNITQNFNLMFDKLYCKYLALGKDVLVRVHTTYHSILERMIRHIKTAFDRIYHNNAEKYDILVVFRRVEDELRTGMAKYRQYLTDSERILQLLTADLQKAFVQLAESTLMPLNKKISKAIIDCPLEEGRFGSTEVDLTAIGVLHREWKGLLDKLNCIYFYKDPPLTRMIFMLLQKMEFTKDGLAAFIIAFEPFLKDIFTDEQARLIKSMVFMEKSKLADVTRDRNNIVRSFLTEEQISILQRLNYTV